MDQSFEEFLVHYLDAWKSSNLDGIKRIISKDYVGREANGQELFDFGYVESIEGWKRGFDYAVENNAKWDVAIHSVFPLRNNEAMAIIEAAIIVDGVSSTQANLFFSTFRRIDGDWKLIRSYIEAGVSRSSVRQSY